MPLVHGDVAEHLPSPALFLGVWIPLRIVFGVAPGLDRVVDVWDGDAILMAQRLAHQGLAQLAAEMEEAIADLPVGVGVHLVADQPVIVEEAVSGFTRALFEAVAIEPPELETCVAILMAKAQAAGGELPEEVAFFIAKRIRSNVRELEGALRRVLGIRLLWWRKGAFHGASRRQANALEQRVARLVQLAAGG